MPAIQSQTSPANNESRCWDGKNLDSPDHKSHVAYPSNGPATFTGSSTGGNCPATHPVKIPQIMLEVCYISHPTPYSLSKLKHPTDRLGHLQIQQQSRMARRRLPTLRPQHRRQHRLRPARRLRLWLERRFPSKSHGHEWLYGRFVRESACSGG
jgi:hypothetical protein